ncbi:hybrid sensor histidine kinase/response regulator [Microbaculum marinisediminis]|uniref:histidine kinase n=1 Tax=Microbaculum marinisediminis TaxID=2931392 RepID=A0AAW5QYC3_9HYPH|nr:ATP-binding protein [Microbaculum sp. A6E488]MCT8971909.1 PAS domain S-box protein [Microbaculum sp. A6E488]
MALDEDDKTATGAPDRIEDAFQLILENCPVPVVAARISDGAVLYQTPAMAAMLRLAPGDPPLKVEDFAIDRDERAECLRLIREHGSVDDFRMHFRRSDGSRFVGSMSARFVEIGGETVIVSNLIDLTTAFEREAEFRRVNETLEDAIEALDDGFVLYDANDRLVTCNSRYREFHSDSADLLVPGAHWPEVTRIRAERGFFVDAIGRVDEWMAEQMGQRGIALREEFPSKEGRWFEYSHRPTRQGGFVSVWNEITERKQMELALRQREEHFRSIVEGHPLPVWMVDLATSEILYESPSAAELFGRAWPSDQRAYTVDHFVDPADRDRLIAELRKSGELYDVELRVRKVDGTVFWASLNDRIIEYEGREVSILSFIDLTARRETAAEAARQREILHQSEKLSALGELLSSVAHELNNPLSVLIGQAVMLQEHASDPDTAVRAEKIGTAADRCARIVKTFLAMARQTSEETAPVDVNVLIEQALEFAAYSLRTTGVDITLRLADDLPVVYANEDQLVQTFTNLIVNAEQALRGTEGPRTLEITTAAVDDGEGVSITFADNGPGIPEEARSRIFEPLFTTKQAGVGTGLGLALCHRIIEGHGGSIELERTDRPGATFTIRLSRDGARSRTAEDEAPHPEQSGAGLRILVIDDEADVGSLIADCLEMDGHTVDVEQSARGALERLKHRHYDVVLSDMRMPELDGVSFYDILKDTNPAQARSLAFITGDTLSRRVSEFLATTDSPYIEKPFMPDDVRELVNRVMSRKNV